MPHRFVVAALLAVVLAAPVSAGNAPLLSGRVTSGADALSGALVIAYDLGKLVSFPVLSGDGGVFSLPSLPVGLYRIVAVKRGFVPAAVRRLHLGEGDPPLVLSLRPAAAGASPLESESLTREEIWGLRSALSPDVLRELDAVLASANDERPGAFAARNESSASRALRGSVAALAGSSSDSGSDAGTVSETRIGFGGALPGGGQWRVGAGYGKNQPISLGQRDSDADLSLDLDTGESHRFRWKSRQTDLDLDRDFDGGTPRRPGERVESHSVTWQQGNGDGGASVLARYVQENPFEDSNPTLRRGRLMEIGGSFSTSVGGDQSIGASIRLRQEQFDLPRIPGQSASSADPARTVDVDASGRSRMAKRFEIEYGALANVAPNGIEASPRLGVAWSIGSLGVVRLSARARVRPREGEDTRPTLPIFLGEDEALDRSEGRSWSFSWTTQAGSFAKPGSTAIGTATPSTECSVEYRHRSIDRPARIFLSAGLGGSFDEVFLPAGSTLREARLAAGRQFGPIHGEATVAARDSEFEGKAGSGRNRFGEAAVRAVYLPLGTEVRVGRSWRRQDLPILTTSETALDRTEVRVGQRLPLPRSWPAAITLLLQGEQASGERSEFHLAGEGRTSDRRWMGGVSFEF